jgi:hypothetical protein
LELEALEEPYSDFHRRLTGLLAETHGSTGLTLLLLLLGPKVVLEGRHEHLLEQKLVHLVDWLHPVLGQ